MRSVWLIVLLTFVTGCSLRSRYALDDPIYQEKYAVGADKDDIAGKLKQATDARHTKYLDGWVAGGGGLTGAVWNWDAKCTWKTISPIVSP